MAEFPLLPAIYYPVRCSTKVGFFVRLLLVPGFQIGLCVFVVGWLGHCQSPCVVAEPGGAQPPRWVVRAIHLRVLRAGPLGTCCCFCFGGLEVYHSIHCVLFSRAVCAFCAGVLLLKVQALAAKRRELQKACFLMFLRLRHLPEAKSSCFLKKKSWPSATPGLRNPGWPELCPRISYSAVS